MPMPSITNWPEAEEKRGANRWPALGHVMDDRYLMPKQKILRVLGRRGVHGGGQLHIQGSLDV